MASPCTQDEPPAWSRSDLSTDPHSNPEKAERVRRMFGAIAHRYDLNNRIHSFGRDQAWRRAAVRAARVRPEDDVLDVACGTGDLTRAFADAGAHSVTGVDFTPEMLSIARTRRLRPRRRHEKAPPVIRYMLGDAMALPFEDARFDIVSIAFGIRNVTDPAKALREFRRVLRPGGRLIILEFGRPSVAPVAWANDLYCRVVMPRTATLISRDRSGAYHYLPRSVETFLSRDEMKRAIAEASFQQISDRALTLGVCVCYRALATT